MKSRAAVAAISAVIALLITCLVDWTPARAELESHAGKDFRWLVAGAGHRAGESDENGIDRVLRSSGGVESDGAAGDLRPGTAFTVTWVIFNHGAACANSSVVARCGPADLGIASTQPSVQYATGGLVLSDGSANFTAALRVGDVSNCAAKTLPCNGLRDPLGADIQLVIRLHGATATDTLLDRTSSYNAGCSAKHKCKDVQAAVHQQGPPSVRGRAIVAISMSNFQFCRSTNCSQAESAYVKEPNFSSPLLNPQGVIDVHPGDTIEWQYRDWHCDLEGDLPYCPGHAVVFEDGRVDSGLLPARSAVPPTFRWRVPARTKPGTVIRYYCDMSMHFAIGMTGALRVVATH